VAVVTLLAGGCGERRPTPIRTACRTAGSPARDRSGRVDATLARRLQATLDRVRRQQGVPGAAAAVVVRGCVWVGSSGVADLRTRDPVRAETLFAIGSVTKPFVAALVLELAEEGKLGLDDRLSRWVPEFPGSGGITLRQLLNHTAGTADYVSDGRFLAAERRRGLAARWTPQQLLRYVPERLARPGERWSYSNTNYLLLGLVVERVTGSTVRRQLRLWVLPRALFTRTVVQVEERADGAVAVGFQRRFASSELEPTPNDPYVPSTATATSAWASGNLLASAGDLARAGDRLFRGDVLEAASKREMTRWVKAVLKPAEYGLGLGRERLGGEDVWGHGGDIDGFHADLWHVPRSGVTVVALLNAQAGADSRDKDHLAAQLIEDMRAAAP
jgi:D-alanyl-D-alanine carboxypeptidase